MRSSGVIYTLIKSKTLIAIPSLVTRCLFITFDPNCIPCSISSGIKNLLIRFENINPAFLLVVNPFFLFARSIRAPFYYSLTALTSRSPVATVA